MSIENIQQKVDRVIESLAKDISVLNVDNSTEQGVSVTEDAGRIKVDVCNSYLTLEQKSAIEKAFKKELEGVSFYVNFRRPKSQMSTPVLPQKSDPFGLNREPKKIDGINNIIVVASGKGGVGKSTMSSNIAVGLAEHGQRVGYLDADIYGPSGALMFGLTSAPKVTSEDKLVPHEAFGVKVASFGTLTDVDSPAIWRGPMISRAFEQLCFQVDWGTLDYLVIDLPPGTGDIQLTMLEKLAVDSAVVVTTPQDMALIDARKAITMFEKLNLPVLGLIENMKTHICSECGHEEAVFGNSTSKLLKAKNIELLGEIPLNMSLRVGADCGEPASVKEGKIKEVFQKIAQKIHESI